MRNLLREQGIGFGERNGLGSRRPWSGSAHRDGKARCHFRVISGNREQEHDRYEVADGMNDLLDLTALYEPRKAVDKCTHVPKMWTHH